MKKDAQMTSKQSHLSDLYRELRGIIESLGEFSDTESLIHYLLAALIESGSATSALIVGGRGYLQKGDYYELFAKYGDAGPAPIGYQVPLTYAPIQRTIRQGWALVRRDDPEYDPAIEGPVGAEVFSAMVLGTNKEYLVSFTLQEPFIDDEVIFTLVSIRQIITHLTRGRERADFIAEAKEIQTSLLPKSPPLVPGWDIAFASRPAELIGGDIYDFYMISDDILGVCIGDATGHGLPAALQARDAIIGLRMGIEEHLKIAKTMEKLARVINASSMTSRYITMFYAEIDRVSGHVVYVNAGHVPPFVLRANATEPTYLREGGPVIGIPVEVRYRRSFTHMEPDDILVMYTDGIIDARNTDGVDFGLPTLIKVVKDNREQPAEKIIEAVFSYLDQFLMAGALGPDDQTLVVVKRLRS